jgi:putative ABC transport system permease protein
MRLIAPFRSWWKTLAHRREMEAEVEAELQFHVERYAEDLMRNGMGREEALRRARAELGSMAVQQEKNRSSRGLRPWDDLRADARYAFRQLRHSPAFTFTVLLVLALGIGANAAMFSIIDATLLRWLPYHRPTRLVSLYLLDERGGIEWAFYQDIQEWQRQSHQLQSMAYYTAIEGFLETNEGQEQVSAQSVSANLFSVLGVQPERGRSFVADEQTAGNNKVIILSQTVWRVILHADPEIVGKTVRLNDQPYTVVGVMPPRFVFPANDRDPQVWVPAELTPEHQKAIEGWTAPRYQAIGRLRNGATPTSVSTELSGIEGRLVSQYPQQLKAELPPSRAGVMPYRETLVKDSRTALFALIAAVSIMWLIACANVANLMLARGMARQREIAVRGALGASRWRIVRQLFTESLILSALGSAAGLGLAQLALGIFDHTLRTQLNLPERLVPDPSVLGALFALSVVSAILFGLLPAWLAAGTPIEHSLRQGTVQAGSSRARHRLQQLMVISEIGLSLVLLVACGLLLRTIFALRKVPLGFRTDHVLMLQPKVPRYKYRNIDTNLTVYQPLLARVKQLPGVTSATITTLLPLHKGFAAILALNVRTDKKYTGPSLHIDAQLKAAGPELKDILGFRMARGRYFTQEDTADSQLVAVVNRAFEKLYMPVGDVMNFNIGLGKGRQAKIVGVIDDFHQTSIDRPAFPEIDFCAPQLRATDGFYQPTLLAHVEIAMRTQTGPEQLVPALRRTMVEVNPDLQAGDIQTMEQVVEDSMGNQLLAAHLLEVFAGSALLVALAGLYGLLAYLVAQRTREMGVRIALGAQRHKIIEMLLGQAGRLLLAGAAVGIVLSYAAARLIASFLYGVKPHDVGTILAVTALLLACGLTAAYVPARRASRVDPMEALRTE